MREDRRQTQRVCVVRMIRMLSKHGQVEGRVCHFRNAKRGKRRGSAICRSGGSLRVHLLRFRCFRFQNVFASKVEHKS